MLLFDLLDGQKQKGNGNLAGRWHMELEFVGNPRIPSGCIDSLEEGKRREAQLSSGTKRRPLLKLSQGSARGVKLGQVPASGVGLKLGWVCIEFPLLAP
jgi:hypothetical protein